MKQYLVEEAYADNKIVTKFVNGKKIAYDIMSYWEVDGYCNALESEEYVRGYDLSEAEQKLVEAKNALKWAEEAYELAKKNPIICL